LYGSYQYLSNKEEIYYAIIYPKLAELMKDSIFMTGLYWTKNLRHGISASFGHLLDVT